MAGAAALTNTFDTTDAIGIREELNDVISNISPTDTPLTTAIGSGSCQTTFFEWQQDSLAAAAENHQPEGFDVTTATPVVATIRVGNWCSIGEKDFRISRTEEKTDKAGRSSERGYQGTKAAKELKRDFEVNYTANNAGVSGSTRETGSILAFLKTNTSKGTAGADPVYSTTPTDARSDGTGRAATEALLQTQILAAYNAGGDPTLIMMSGTLKQVASGFAGIAAQRYQAPSSGETTIMAGADLYQSNFGLLQMVPNRHMRTIDMLVIDPAEIRERVFDGYEMTELAKTGDSRIFLLTCEKGLEVTNEAAHALVTDLT